MEGNGMGWSEWIALGAAVASSVISIFSWRWAKASADAAKRANFLQLHSYREILYVALHELNGRFLGDPNNIDRDLVAGFNRHAITCFLYTTPRLSNEIKKFHGYLIELLEIQKGLEAVDSEIALLARRPYTVELGTAQGMKQTLISEREQLKDSASPLGLKALESLGKQIELNPDPKWRWFRSEV